MTSLQTEAIGNRLMNDEDEAVGYLTSTGRQLSIRRDVAEAIKAKYSDPSVNPRRLAYDLKLELSALRRYASLLGVVRGRAHTPQAREQIRKSKVKYWCEQRG